MKEKPTEIGINNFEARLNQGETEVLNLVVDWLKTFPLIPGEKMWCIGVGGIANNKPLTGDIDIRIFLQLGNQTAPQTAASYSAAYERLEYHILEQLQISPAYLKSTITSPPSERSSPLRHPHIEIRAPNCKPFHLTTSTNTLEAVQDQQGNARYLIRSDAVDLAQTYHYGQSPPYSQLGGTRFCVFVDRVG